MALDSPYTLNNVRSLKNYGLYIIGNTYDPIFAKGIVQSKPNILINGSTCTIDYSHVFDMSDKTYFKKTFGKFSAGETFSISTSEYYDEQNNIRTNISGTLRLSSTTNDNQIVTATIVSGMTGVTGYNYFSKNNFTQTPQYTFTSTGGTVGYFLVNSLPNISKTTFKSMGIIGSAFGFEEYISISGGTAQNIDKIQVYGTTTLKDNTEVLYFTSGGTAQDFSSTASTVSLYLRGYPYLITAPYNSNVTGILTVNTYNTGDLVYCFENQSLNQASLRKSKLASGYSADYNACESCYDLIYGSGIGTTVNVSSPAFSNLLYLVVYNQSNVSSITATRAAFLATSTTSVNIASLSNTILKIDMSHPSLLGYNLEVYYDAGHNNPFGSGYSIYGIPGYNGAYAILNNYPTATTLYCILSGLSTIYFTIAT